MALLDRRIIELLLWKRTSIYNLWMCSCKPALYGTLSGLSNNEENVIFWVSVVSSGTSSPSSLSVLDN